MDTDDTKLLLPWYVNGTLHAEEQAAVVAHLDRCPACRKEVAELRRVSLAVETAQATPLVPEPRVSEFLDQALGRSGRSGSPRHLPWIAVAASVLALVAISYIVANVVPDRNVFRTATDPRGPVEIAYVFDMNVRDGAHESVYEAVSTSFAGGHIVKSEDGFRVTISMPSVTMNELELLADSLRQVEGVRHVDIVGVQLPIE